MKSMIKKQWTQITAVIAVAACAVTATVAGVSTNHADAVGYTAYVAAQDADWAINTENTVDELSVALNGDGSYSITFENMSDANGDHWSTSAEWGKFNLILFAPQNSDVDYYGDVTIDSIVFPDKTYENVSYTAATDWYKSDNEGTYSYGIALTIDTSSFTSTVAYGKSVTVNFTLGNKGEETTTTAETTTTTEVTTTTEEIPDTTTTTTTEVVDGTTTTEETTTTETTTTTTVTTTTVTTTTAALDFKNITIGASNKTPVTHKCCLFVTMKASPNTALSGAVYYDKEELKFSGTTDENGILTKEFRIRKGLEECDFQIQQGSGSVMANLTSYYWGDSSLNGKVNGSDVRAIINYIKSQAKSDRMEIVCDYNDDKSVSIADAVALTKALISPSVLPDDTNVNN